MASNTSSISLADRKKAQIQLGFPIELPGDLLHAEEVTQQYEVSTAQFVGIDRAVVEVKVQLLAVGHVSMKSPRYQAAQRRRSAVKLLELADALTTETEPVHWPVLSAPLIEMLHSTLKRFEDVPSEGNTREILRIIRDSFLDGGWARYRNMTSLKVLRGVLERLASSETIDEGDVDFVFDVFYDHGLNNVVPPDFQARINGENQEIPN